MLIVSFELPRKRMLPMTRKIGDKNVTKYFSFLPGHNDISQEEWELVKETNKDTWHYYGQAFKVVGGEVAEKDGKTNLDKLDDSELTYYIQNCTDEKVLYDLKKKEIAGKRKSKKAIIKAIDTRTEFIEDMLRRRNK